MFSPSGELEGGLPFVPLFPHLPAKLGFPVSLFYLLKR